MNTTIQKIKALDTNGKTLVLTVPSHLSPQAMEKLRANLTTTLDEQNIKRDGVVVIAQGLDLTAQETKTVSTITTHVEPCSMIDASNAVIAQVNTATDEATDDQPKSKKPKKKNSATPQVANPTIKGEGGSCL